MKTNAQMLKGIKQYNKVTRERKALKEGFATSVAFIAYLENQVTLGFGNNEYSKPNLAVNAPVTKQKKSPIHTKVNRPIIHVVDIIDKSGSMSGGKDKAAVKGINIGVDHLLKDTAEVDYTYTLCDFSDTIIFRNTMVNLDAVKPLKEGTRNSTSLYDAIGETIEVIKQSKGETDKVLVNIYTDGQENSSKKFSSGRIAQTIEQLSEQGWTFTFIGTRFDVEYAQRHLKFDITNTLVHDNTAASISKGMSVNSVARSSYSAKVVAGEDVSKGFYKDIK